MVRHEPGRLWLPCATASDSNLSFAARGVLVGLLARVEPHLDRDLDADIAWLGAQGLPRGEAIGLLRELEMQRYLWLVGPEGEPGAVTDRFLFDEPRCLGDVLNHMVDFTEEPSAHPALRRVRLRDLPGYSLGGE